jgi:DNA-binding response OmpR family regulator
VPTTDAPLLVLIDDDADLRDSARAVLQLAGYCVLTAGDGEAGLALAERHGPAVVVVDMMMPRLSGFVVLERLRARPGGGPRVVMVTGNDGRRHRAYAEFLGAAEYLVKPFPLARLVEAVRRLCPPPTAPAATNGTHPCRP